MGKLIEPRWQTPLPPAVVGSWGPDVAAAARTILGLRLDLWQRRALNRALAYDRDGVLCHQLYIVSTGRQAGKTVLVRALIGWALTTPSSPPWATIAGLANDSTQAQIPYRAVLGDLAPVARRVGPIGRGGLALTRYMGIRSAMHGRDRFYRYWSREARDALRGESIDLGVFDEVRTQRDFDTWAALEPTTTARPDPLILAISTAGDDRSVLLRDWYDRGRRIIDGAEAAHGFGMTWYAAPDDLDPRDPRAIKAANPSVAEGRIPIAPILASSHSLSPAAYRSERLNLWSDAVDEWLPPGTWKMRTAPVWPMALEGRPVLGIETTPNLRRLTVVVAGRSPDGGSWIATAAEHDASLTTGAISPDDVRAALTRAAVLWRPSAIAYNAGAGVAREAEAYGLSADIPTLPLGPRHLRLASDLFRAELVAGRLVHADDPLTAYQSRNARPSGPIDAGDWYLSTRESPGDIDAIRAAAWAVWALLAPPETEYPRVQLF